MVAWLAALVVALAGAQDTTSPSGAAPPPEKPVAASAPPADTSDAATTVEGLTVTAAPNDTITAFVDDISAPTLNKVLPRWDRKICPGVVGMKRDYAQYLIDRMAKTAFSVGLDVGAEGCKPNILVFVTDDGDAFSSSLVDKYPAVFAKYGMEDHVVTRGRKALAAFTHNGQPVRWWHISVSIGADGVPIQDQTLRVRDASHIRSNVREDFAKLIIIIDAKKAGHVSLEGLSSYVSMVALAQIDPDAHVEGVPTILNLFNDRDAGVTPEPTLTVWDMAYLKGLYEGAPDTKDAKAQRRRIARHMKSGGADK